MKQKKDTETTPRQQYISHFIQFAPFMRLYGTYQYTLDTQVCPEQGTPGMATGRLGSVGRYRD